MKDVPFLAVAAKEGLALPRPPKPSRPPAKQRAAAPTIVAVPLDPDQVARLDEWIAERADPKPSRAEALVLHFEWSVARAASLTGDNARSTIPGEFLGRDVLG